MEDRILHDVQCYLIIIKEFYKKLHKYL